MFDVKFKLHIKLNVYKKGMPFFILEICTSLKLLIEKLKIKHQN